MVLELDDFAAEDTDYVQKMNANNAALESFINALAAQVSATTGDGAILLQDLFDRPGVVGSHSYVLDIDAYAGGDAITIGRRPAPFTEAGETDVSIAWGLFGGEWQRVSMTSDLEITAAGIVAGLPKTVYIGIPSSGVPQFYEDGDTPSVIMVYSATWDGVDLSEFHRLTHILPAYSLIQSICAAPRQLSVMDTETDWLDVSVGDYSDSVIVLPGGAPSNAIDVDGMVELIGFFLHVPKQSGDGFDAVAADSTVELSVRNDDDDDLVESHFEIDGNDPTGLVFKGLAGGIGDAKFVRTSTTLRLKLEAIGADVSSARCFTWGVFVRPLLGANAPKDSTKVKQI